MSNSRRRTERKREIAELRTDGALARQQGKPRSSVSFKAYESANHCHWLDGWDAEDDRIRQDIRQEGQNARACEHGRSDC